MSARDPELFQHFKGHTGSVLALAYSPKDGRLVSCSTDKSVMVWQVGKIVGLGAYCDLLSPFD